MIQLSFVVWQEEKHFVAQCLNIDLSSFGETKQEALDNLHEAVSLYFEDTDVADPPQIHQPEIVQATFQYA